MEKKGHRATKVKFDFFVLSFSRNPKNEVCKNYPFRKETRLLSRMRSALPRRRSNEREEEIKEKRDGDTEDRKIEESSYK